MIVRAKLNDSSVLTMLAIASKGYWGYSNDLMASWEEDLRVTSQMIEELIVFKFLINERITGFYILNNPVKERIQLEFLFVDPIFIKKGIGNALLMHAFEQALNKKCRFMNVLSDPNAVSYYKKNGFIIIDKQKSSVPNRYLPILQKDLIAGK